MYVCQRRASTTAWALLVDEDDGYAAFNNKTLASYGYSYGYYTQFRSSTTPG